MANVKAVESPKTENHKTLTVAALVELLAAAKATAIKGEGNVAAMKVCAMLEGDIVNLKRVEDRFNNGKYGKF